jgi:hypothetical protein
MAYLGKTPSQAVRQRYYFTASGGETSLSGADDNGNTLNFTDGAYVDVYLNGVLLVAGTDYNTSTANTIGGLTALSASDVVELVVYDTFAVFGGEVQGDMTVTNGALKTTDITAVDSNGIQFNTDEGTERARVDDSGNLLVGKTSTDFSVDGVICRGDGRFVGTSSGNPVIQINRKNSDGNIAEFYKDGSTVGSIGNTGSRLFISGASSMGIKFAPEQFQPVTTSGTDADATFDIGIPNNRFRNLYLSGGVYVGGTGAANKLDDYEEGTFTPTLSGGATGVTYSTQIGAYRKVGTLVTYQLQLDVSAATASASLIKIGGLPFSSAAAATNGHGGAFLNYQGGFNTNAGDTFHHLNSDNELGIYTSSGAARTGNGSGITLGARFDLCGYYFTAA